MTLEELLKPVKWVDTQVVKGYTRVGERFHLEEGKRKYVVGSFCSIGGGVLSLTVATNIDLAWWEALSSFGIGVPDALYNLWGITQNTDSQTSEERTLNPQEEFYRGHNNIARFPALISGVGLIGKFGYDLYSSIKEGTALSQDSYDYLQWGLGQLALASSMYFKAMDPKLLNKSKQPFWQRVYSSIKERIGSLAPQPAPLPVPVATYSTIENTIDTYLLKE